MGGKNKKLIPPLWLVKTAILPARRATATRKPSPSLKQTKEQPVLSGKHLTIDAHGIPFERLRDARSIYNLLDDLPGMLGMRKLTSPQLAFVQQDDRKGDWGISGFVMIYESHISLHTWPETGYVSMDVYSCKDFDDKKVLQLMKDFWGATKINTHVIRRG